MDAERSDLAERFKEVRASNEMLGSSLENERKALARETHSIQRETSARLATIAELLGRMCSHPVASDDPAILGSLFELNETLVTERLSRAQAEEQLRILQGRVAGLESNSAAERERLAAEQARRQALAAARAALAEEIRVAVEELAAIRAEAAEQGERLTSELAARGEDLAAEQARRQDLEAEREVAFAALRDEQARLVSLREQVKKLEAQILSAKGRGMSAAEASEPSAVALQSGVLSPTDLRVDNPQLKDPLSKGSNRATGNTSNPLALLHRRTRLALASAPGQIAGRIAPPQERAPLPLHRRLLGKERILDTSIFSSEWLTRQNASLRDVSLKVYLSDPRNRTVSPHPLFDSEFYLTAYPDVADSGMFPLVHYVMHGWREGRDPHPLFPNDWYLAQNPDVVAHGQLSPLDHYLMHGWKEGRWPNPLFNPRSYLERYPDVEAAEFEPLTHFILYGEGEGRELTIDGWSQVLQDVATQGGPLHVMQRLLREPPDDLPQPPSFGQDEVPISAPWPPTPADDFWPTQTMREMIAETYGEPLFSRIGYLLSLMIRWQDRQGEFASSEDCSQLLARLRVRANAVIPAEDHVPSATVIIPVYNNVLDTLLCLASLLELDERHDFEVIVADDGSSDATAALVTTVGGMVRYVRQPRNLGFLGNCNGAAAQALGKTIVLLNNDTLVFTGWLDGLLDPFQQFSEVGLVGSKLINWDGTLQEAGGIFWRDGSAWNFGRNQDSRAPEFNYLKDVDYCSGASIAIPASIWRELGGFDTMYSPAYCEDSDMAFRLRKAGYRTLYSPASAVVHHEGRSHGCDVASGVKAYQVTNQQRLLERWRPVLERDHYPNAENVLRARDRSFARLHVLVIDHYVPQWDQDAGSRTIFDFLQVLVQAGHAVTFWPDNLWRDPDYTPRLQALGIEVIFGTRYRDGFEQFLVDREGLYDMVLLSRPHISVNYVDAIRRLSDARVVYYGHDVHFTRMMAERELTGRPVEDDDVLAMKAQELGICNASDLVLFPSAEEKKLIAGLVHPGVEVRSIPAYRYLEEELAETRKTILTRADDREPLHLLFVGGFAHSPNVDGALWFCQSVMPLLRSGRKVRLSIAGSRPPAEVLALKAADIEVLGFVSDDRLRSLYRQAHIAVAPLRFGAGVKGKVIEAMARGCPVVTTGVGAQGIEGAEELMFIGDRADAFAAQVLRAAEPRMGRERALAALDFIERQYSAQAMAGVLEMGISGAAALSDPGR
ncbi:MAG: glycosyltransferase [Alphaproteobacteria bacterium]|nr:glycosyltransferase [Alphaproteobacteria bacterium]